MQDPGDGHSHPKNDAAIAAAVSDYLQSSEAIKLLEGKVLEYALEKKAQEALKNYLTWRVFPPIAVLAIVLAYFGLDIRSSFAHLKTESETTLRGLTNLQKDVQRRSEELGLSVEDLERTKDMVAAKLDVFTARADRQMSTSADTFLRHAISSAEQIARAEQAVLYVDKITTREMSKVDQLNSSLSDAEKRVNGVDAKLRLQATLINTAILEIVSVNDRSTSNDIDLHHLNRAPSRLSFTASKITRSKTGPAYVDLVVHLDGTDSDVRIEATPDGNWRRWRQLGSSASDYEYRVDHVYYDEKANDFVSIHVRGTKEFVQSLMQPEMVHR